MYKCSYCHKEQKRIPAAIIAFSTTNYLLCRKCKYKSGDYRDNILRTTNKEAIKDYIENRGIVFPLQERARRDGIERSEHWVAYENSFYGIDNWRP
jgi:hypothetical protein